MSIVTGELERRISKWLPPRITSPVEIEEAVTGTGWTENLTQSQVDDIVSNMSNRRDSIGEAGAQLIERSVDVMGEPGKRVSQIRAADGTILGPEENVVTWDNGHGTIMGRNVNTGTQKKIGDN